MKCAVIIIIGPAEYGSILDRCRNSINGAIAHSKGPFSDVEIIEADGSEGKKNRAQLINETAESLSASGFDWFLLLDADGLIFNQAFQNFHEKFGVFDALWGFIADFNVENNQLLKRDKQLANANSLNQVVFSHPYLSLGFTHFVKADKFFEVGGFMEGLVSGAEDYDYFFRLWSTAKCAKFDLPLSAHNHKKVKAWGIEEGSKEWLKIIGKVFADFFTRQFVNVSFELSGIFYSFHITNSLEHIQQYHIARTFFELKELEYIKTYLDPNSIVLDVGANIGNHTIFWAKNIPDSRYICFEPNDPVANHLETNLMINGLSDRVQVLRKAVGDSEGFVSMGEVDVLNQGATKVVHDDNSGIELVSLDGERVLEGLNIDFIKVDVEGFELGVIRGAKLLLARCKPLLFVEVANENKPEFGQLIDEMGYNIEKEFRNVHASNFICVPAGS